MWMSLNVTKVSMGLVVFCAISIYTKKEQRTALLNMTKGDARMKTNRKSFGLRSLCMMLAMLIVMSVMPTISVHAAEVSYDVFSANVATYNAKGDVESVAVNEDWNVNLVDSSNVEMQESTGWWGTEGHWANANVLKVNCLYSDAAGGYATFKVPADEGVTITKLILNGRNCANTAVSFAISNAVDGEFTTVYTVEEKKSGSDTEVDISDYTADWDEVYVKAIFPPTGCPDWVALWNIRAVGKTASKPTPPATVEKPVSYDIFAANIPTYADNGDVASVAKNESWNANLAASENVEMKTSAGWSGTDGHWANPNNSVNALYSDNDGGYAVFKVPSDDGATIKTLTVNARSCNGTAVSFAIANAVDGDFQTVYTVTDSVTGQDVEVDISAYTADWDEVYVKAIFPSTMCADWAAMWNIRAAGTIEETVEVPTVEEPVSYDVFDANTCTYDELSGNVTNTELNPDWNANLVASENAEMKTSAGWSGTKGHWANHNASVNAMYSTNDGGYAIFRVPADEGAIIRKLIVNARNCAGTAVSFAIANAVDGDFRTVYTVESEYTGQDVEVDISAYAEDWDEVYVKAIFPSTMCADWAAMWNIRAEGVVLVPVEMELVDVYNDVFAANSCTYDELSGNVTATELNPDWNVNLVDFNNAEMKTSAGWQGSKEHWANHNATVNALYSTNDGGYATFKINVEEGTTLNRLLVNGRSCNGTAVSFAVSNAVDGNFTKVYTVTDGASGTDVEVDISDAIEGWDEVYVRAIFPSTGCADWAALWTIRAISTKAVPKDPGEKYEPNPTDVKGTKVLHWEIGKEDKYGLSGEGVERTTVNATAGAVSDDYNVLVLGAGQTIRFEVPAELGTATNLAMELREIHKHGDGKINYTVALNGQSLLDREVTPLSEGAIHTWVDINKNNLTGSDVITITNRGEQDVRLESVWFYENSDALMVEEDVYRPLEVVLFTLPVTYTDYAKDLATVKAYMADYSGYEKYSIAMAFDIFYMAWEDKVLFERLDWLMRLSAETGAPLYLDLNSWWSGTPNGMDGKGGFWGDLTYQQVIYDPDNVNGQGIWQLSTPNIWSNTPWLSMNESWYNEVRNQRLEMVSDYLAQKQAEYAAKGQDVDLNIFMENEPTYWAYSHYNTSTTSGRADLSYTVIQDAARKGFTLDPTDGLSDEEQKWLFDNHTPYIEAEGAAVASGLGSNAIRIVDGKVTYPTSQMTEKVFSHVQTAKQTIGGITYPSWEYHLTENLRMGLEYAYPYEMSATELQYVAARGTFADVNIERSALQNFNVLSQLYEAGADYAIIFNVHRNDYGLVEDQDSALSAIAETVKSRTRNLWVACRADVERLLESTVAATPSASVDLEAAKAAYENGRYETAYDLLMKIGSTGELPMDFVISGTGTLLDYPVTITAADAVNVRLYSAGDTLKLRLTSQTAQEVSVTWEGVAAYTVTDLGGGVYELTKGGDRSGAAHLTSAAYYHKDYPDAFEAVFKGYSNGSIRITTQDASISEYVNYVTLKLADNCVITRAQEGKEADRKTVSVSELSNYDALELKLNENDEVVEIRATYGYVTGRVVSIQYPVVDGMVGLENPSITIRTIDGAEHTYEICAITGFSYPSQTGHNMQTSDLTDYGLKAGDKIKISYSPYTCNGSSIKAIKVYKDDYTKIVLDEDFEDGDFGDCVSTDNVFIRDLDGNYHNKVLTADDKGREGSIVWRIQQDGDAALRDVTIKYRQRNILNTGFRFYVSYDEGQTWKLICDQAETGEWQSDQYIYLTNVTANSMLLKCELDSKGTGDPDTWSCLDLIQVKIPTGDMIRAEEVDKLILAIGEVTKDSGDAIAKARKAYDALTDAQKDMVENDDVLLDAEKAYQAILDGDKDEPGDITPSKDPVKEVTKLIDVIGTVTADSGDAIKAARNAYDALTSSQQKRVKNYDTLVEAEKAYQAILDASKDLTDEDRKAADEVEKLIDAIDTTAPGAEDAVKAAREAYDALTEAQKELVKNRDTLTKAEAELNMGKPDPDDKDRQDAPKTGDAAQSILWTMALAGMGLTIGYLLKKKREF